MEVPAYDATSGKLTYEQLLAYLNKQLPRLFGAVTALARNFNAQQTGKNVAAAYVATLEDGLIRADATAGAFSITLPPASIAGRKRLTVKKVDGGANAVTIDAAGAELIDGALTKVLGAWGVVTIQANDVGWDVL